MVAIILVVKAVITVVGKVFVVDGNRSRGLMVGC